MEYEETQETTLSRHKKKKEVFPRGRCAEHGITGQ